MPQQKNIFVIAKFRQSMHDCRPRVFFPLNAENDIDKDHMPVVISQSP
jgi:hypothetical protein